MNQMLLAAPLPLPYRDQGREVLGDKMTAPTSAVKLDLPNVAWGPLSTVNNDLGTLLFPSAVACCCCVGWSMRLEYDKGLACRRKNGYKNTTLLFVDWCASVCCWHCKLVFFSWVVP